MEQNLNHTAIVSLSNNTFEEDLKRTKKQEVLDVIEAIRYEHRIGTSGMMGPYTANEAKREYEKLMATLASIPGLSTEDAKELTELIKTEIKNIPNVEKEKEEEYEAAERKHKEAFEEAKKRFKALSPVKQLKLKLAGKDPEQIDPEWLSIRELDELYKES